LDPGTCRATREHEDLVHAGPPRVAFHWFARFADHVPFENPPLGPVDDRTGRLRFNASLTALADALAVERAAAAAATSEAASAEAGALPGGGDEGDVVVVVGTQIFDVLKAPLADYRDNLGRLVAAMREMKATAAWRTGDALHDAALDAQWVRCTLHVLHAWRCTSCPLHVCTRDSLHPGRLTCAARHSRKPLP
jgi:hypothetical protein